MKMTKEQTEAVEMLAEQATIILATSLEKSGNLELAKDVLCQFFIALLHGRNNPLMRM